MTDISNGFAAHLAGEVTTLCQCWRLTRADGKVMGFTDHDRVIVCDATRFEPSTGFSASEAKSTFGLSVDTVDVEGALSAADIREEDIGSGLYDAARIETFLVNWNDPAQFSCLRVAVIGKVTRRDGSFVAELESLTQALDQPNGKTVRRHCDAELGDSRCGMVLEGAAYVGMGTLTGQDEGDLVSVEGLGDFADGWFANGLLTWSSGDASGRSERVTGHLAQSGGTARLSLWREGTLPVRVGDTFRIVAGCDKSFSSCREKFSNGVNFRGFPHLPGDDAAYGYVNEGGHFDGGVLVP